MTHMNLRPKAMLMVLGLACIAPVHATTQVPEIVLIDGGVYHLWPHQNGGTVPLELLWHDPTAKLGKPAYRSDCHRGYTGIWEIHDDCLFLKGLHGWSNWPADKRLDMKTLFPERFKAGRARADWFSGELTFASSFGRHINDGLRSVSFAQGKVVSPATAQRIGMADGMRVAPPTQADVPIASVDGDRQLPDERGDSQMPDTFILDGVVYYLPAQFSVKAFPLESLWKDPEARPRLAREPDGTGSSGYVRGYRAIWEVHEGSLFILALETWTHGQKVHLKTLFPDRFRDGRLKADWYSGELALISHETCPHATATIRQNPPLDAPKVTLKIKDGNVVSVTHFTRETK